MVLDPVMIRQRMHLREAKANYEIILRQRTLIQNSKKRAEQNSLGQQQHNSKIQLIIAFSQRS